jgi:DNA-directed RNA polymerase specialized sigma24 family protein
VLFDRHFDTVYRYLERRVGRDGADELPADVFRLAFEQRSRFRPLHESALPWLYGFATRLVLKRWRSEGRHLRALARLDAAPLERATAVRDRHQLGAQVAGAAACAWIERWLAARRGADEAVELQAVATMATSHNWTALREMDADGDYPEVLWEYADAMTTGAPVGGGKPVSVEKGYRAALGFDDS